MSNSEKIMIKGGIAHYPALNRPDTRFDENGMYKADLILSEEEASPLIATLQEKAKALTGKALPRAKNAMFENVLDDEGAATGDVLFKLRVKNRIGKDGKTWDRRPLIVDTKKNKLATDVNIWGGSKLNVQAEIYEWAFNGKKGINLQPLAVQVVDLVTGNGGPDLSDFDEFDDGYTAPDATEFDDESSDASTAAASSGSSDY